MALLLQLDSERTRVRLRPFLSLGPDLFGNVRKQGKILSGGFVLAQPAHEGFLQFFGRDEDRATPRLVAPVVAELLLGDPRSQALIALCAAYELAQRKLWIQHLSRLCSLRASCQNLLHLVEQLLSHDGWVNTAHYEITRLHPASIDGIAEHGVPRLSWQHHTTRSSQAERRNGAEHIVSVVIPRCHQLEAFAYQGRTL